MDRFGVKTSTDTIVNTYLSMFLQYLVFKCLFTYSKKPAQFCIAEYFLYIHLYMVNKQQLY